MGEPTLSRQERRRLERTAQKAYLRQSYMPALMDATKVPVGHVTIAHIAHDDWCPKLSGGLCRCEPDITYDVLPKPSEVAA